MARTPRNLEEAFHNARAAVNKVPFFSGSMRQSLILLLDHLEDLLCANEKQDSPEPASVPAEPPSPSGGSSSPTKPPVPEPPSLGDVVGKDDDI
jgi:hypothetical protein